ncbi:hypothetical protein [Streptomyces pratensis]|uniref:hypothetical protein n=1 Tax=Streptomyces pratensis TaxID=1169025 RepID=UPI0030181B7D
MTTARSPQRADGWTAAVRQRLGLGRLLPLGGPADGTWIAETAAASVLRGAVAAPGTVLGRLRIGWAGEEAEQGTAPDATAAPPAPPSALPAGPLRIEAEFSAALGRPLPDAAAALRAALISAAAARLGLEVSEVDLRVTALLDPGAPGGVTSPPDGGEAGRRSASPDAGEAGRGAPRPPEDAAGPGAAPLHEGRADAFAPAAFGAEADGPVATAAASVPGVVALTRVLGSAVHTGPDHVRIEVATAADHRALDVARSVRTAVSAATEGRLPVSVLVTDVVEPRSDG